ncbi:HU family DNA-binding protein [Cytobacillus kochii]|uniref:HU family DNA-binding protein n=1 Tax=Cytobacillus kochii TaxID=859143 RepID=UPI001CD6CA6E|nr:HU family DNA-binding protein [Cytobacillus kochii]MCA1025689.1 HU family DNA-binding protein [Cytobacillus kochii]
MKKVEKEKLIAAHFDIPQKDATALLDKFVAVIEEGLVDYGEFPLGKLGKLVVKESAARKGRNPQTGEEIEIAARNNLKVKPSAHIKEKLNK